MTHTIVQAALSDLREPEANPNQMSAEAFGLLVHGIECEGFLQPVLARDQGDGTLRIVDGVHRARAAKAVGMTHVPAVVLPPEYPVEKERLLQIAMNRLRGELDLTQVAATFAELLRGLEDVDLTLSGFGQHEIDALVRATADINATDLLNESARDISIGKGGGDEDAGVFELLVQFRTADELKAVKRALKKAAGKNKTLGEALLSVLGLE